MEFDPDRFLDDRVSKYLTANPFIFIPFNAGPRICLGQQVCLPCYYLSTRICNSRPTQFAYNEASFFIVRMLQMFDTIDLALDAQPPESLPPAHSRERLWIKSNVTIYFVVRCVLLLVVFLQAC